MIAPGHNSSSRWFESLSPNRSPLLRLFCFPYAGGSAHVFREWQRHLGPDVDLCLVHLAGRARRIGERPHTRLRPLVEEVADVMRLEGHTRFAFYGHSMGALIAFELARELRRRSRPLPAHLFFSACRAPSAVRGAPVTFNLPHRDFMAALEKLNGTPLEFFERPEIQKTLLPLLRADFEITDTYEYLTESPLACPINLYGGDRDELAAVESLSPWQVETSGECQIHLFSGGHFFIQTHKAEFLRMLRRDIFLSTSAT